MERVERILTKCGGRPRSSYLGVVLHVVGSFALLLCLVSTSLTKGKYSWKPTMMLWYVYGSLFVNFKIEQFMFLLGSGSRLFRLVGSRLSQAASSPSYQVVPRLRDQRRRVKHDGIIQNILYIEFTLATI
jgi:hypothetical protein